MVLDGIFNIELENIENGICVETVNTNLSRKVKIIIPKLMALIDKHEPKKEVLYLNKNIIANDKKTLPQEISYNIITTNYLELELSDKAYINTTITKDQKVLVFLPNKNIKNMKIIEL